MPIKLISYLACCAFLFGCSSYTESLKTLNEIHQTPASIDAPSENKGENRFLEYAGALVIDEEVEEIEDPVELCLDCIEEIREEGADSEIERSRSLVVLSRCAIRSPSQIVRAAAMKALIHLFSEESLENVKRPGLEVEKEALNRDLNLFMGLHDREVSPEGLSDQEIEQYLKLANRFGDLRFLNAMSAWKTLDLLVVKTAAMARTQACVEIWEKVSRKMNIWTFYLTTLEATRDPSEVVRDTALSSFFLFPLEFFLEDLKLEIKYNYFLQAPLHRIKITSNLLKMADKPEDIGLDIIKYVASDIKFAQSGVAHHSVALLKKLTGINEEDPEFWDAWWGEFLITHAGDR